MSLVVWLPLNGDLTQQGLSNVTVTNNGATVDNNGKIGKCYKCSGDSRISFPSFNWMTMKPQNNFSFFFWAKGTTNGWLFACSAWEFRLCPGYIQIHLAGNGQYPARYTSTFDTNTWYHLGFTWSGSDGKLLLYLNGSKVAESNVPSSANYDIASTFNLPYDGPRYLNDVRIYDHALSAKEVKELAKGLVLHYRLAGPGGINHFKGYTGNGQELRLNDYASTSGSFTQFYNCLDFDPATTVGKQYTISFWAKSPNGSSPLSLYNSNGNPRYFHYSTNLGTVDTEWKFYKYTFTNIDRGSSYSAGTHPVEIYATSKMGVLVKHIKVEEGSVATPWCPNPEDALYSAMGYNNNIEYDCSGYNRNGTKNGTITLDADSPRYTTSYKMGGTGTSIVGPSDFSHLNTFTYSCWFNRKTTENAYLIMGYQYGNNSSGSLAVSKNGFAGFHCYRFSTGYAETHIAGNINYNDGKWHMLTVTYENNIIKVYVDGIKTAEKNNISLLTSNRTFVINYPSGSINNSEYRDYKGLLSDARVYATALSAEDIAELYHSAVIVDNTGKNYAYEYFEAN